MNRDGNNGFFISNKKGIEKIEAKKKEIHDYVYECFIDSARKQKQAEYIFRVAKPKQKILTFRESDYPRKGDFYEAGQGCSLLNLFGCIYHGFITGKLYISPLLHKSIDGLFLEDLPKELILVADKSENKSMPDYHFALGVSDLANEAFITQERLANCLEIYGHKFVDIEVDVERFSFKKGAEERVKYVRDIVNKLLESKILKDKKYGNIISELKKYQEILKKMPGGIIKKIAEMEIPHV